MSQASHSITAAARAQPKVTLFSFLDHSYEADPARPRQRAPSRPELLAPAKMDPGFASSAELDSYLAQIAGVHPPTKPFDGLRFAVVDLARSPRRFAGHNADKQLYIASTAKVAAMYAAFQLQYDLNALAKKNPSWRTKKELFDGAWQTWLVSQQPARLPPGAPVPLVFANWNPHSPHPRADGSPHLENIFDVDESKSPLEVDFKKTSTTSLKARQCEELGMPGIADLPFYERMWLMIDASHNYAARSCILDVGFLYIASCLHACGLYNTGSQTGLWLSATYVPALGPTWHAGRFHPISGTHQDGTAKSLATFLTLLADGRLVSPYACEEMRKLLSKEATKHPALPGASLGSPQATSTDSLTRSPVGEGIGDPALGYPFRPSYPQTLGLRILELHSKLGLGPPPPAKTMAYDAAIVRCKHPVTHATYTFAAVGLDARTDPILWTLARNLGASIVATH